MSAFFKSSNVSDRVVDLLDASSTSEHDHFVQFYDSDCFLTESVRDFVVAGLRNGDDAVVVATQAHREQLDLGLEAAGIDVRVARTEGRYRPFDISTVFRLRPYGLPL